MRLAILLQCHKNAEQINMLLSALKHECIDIFVHLDRKSPIANEINRRDGVYFLPDRKRVSVEWSMFSQVEATLNMLKYAMETKEYDYYCLISGQDFPLVKSDLIVDFLKKNEGTNFINLRQSLNNNAGRKNYLDKRCDIYYPEWMLKKGFFRRALKRVWVAATGGYNKTFKLFMRKNTTQVEFYFGSQWWCIYKSFAKYACEYINEHRQYKTFFINTNCSDEIFFQTLFMNSPYRDKRQDYLHYIDWSEGKNSPKTLTTSDFEMIKSSGRLFARKFDISIDRIIE